MPGAPAPNLVLVKTGQTFGGLEGFFDAPALAGHGHQGAQWHRFGAVAAQVSVLAGGVVASDQQMVDTGVGVIFGQQPKPSPRIQPRSVRAGAGGVLLPGVGRDQRREGIDADRAGVGGYAAVGRDGQHIAQLVAAHGRPQLRVGAIHFIPSHPRRGNFCGHSTVDQRAARAGLVAKTRLSSGIPASAQRSESSHHDVGRYSARSIRACPRGAA